MKKKALRTAPRANPADHQKIVAEIDTLQKQADAAKKAAQTAKAECKLARKKYKEARRAAKKLKKAVKALKAEFASLGRPKALAVKPRRPRAVQTALVKKIAEPSPVEGTPPVPVTVPLAEILPPPTESTA